MSVMYETRPTLIAEIGCNHRGELETAREMIQVAAQCGADVVKFQKRTPRECLTPEQYDAPHPVPENSYGATYGEHRERLEFNLWQHGQLKEWCEEAGVVYSTSVWDLTSAEQIVRIQPRMIKVPSACNQNFKLLDYLCRTYGGEIHVSLGMVTREEERSIVSFLASRGAADRTVLYACTSGYPVPFEDLCLLEVERIRQEYAFACSHFPVKAVGFSGHHLGIAADIAAMTLGATYIERHFTLDRTWKGTDHAASLEPSGLAKLARDLSNVHQALRYRPDGLLDIERPQREKLKAAQVIPV